MKYEGEYPTAPQCFITNQTLSYYKEDALERL